MINGQKLQQGNLIELEITDLNSSGDGVGKIDGQVIFVPDTVTGDRCSIRLLKLKSKYAEGKLEKVLQPSPHRIRPRCIVADKCGGCQWQHIDYEYQLQVKCDRVYQALQRIGGFSQPNVAPILSNSNDLHYRNKSTYPLNRAANGNVQAGYYRQGSHQLINLNQCPVQDSRLNPLLAEIKQDIQQQGWSIYNEQLHRGKLRHLSLRIGRHTGEILLTLVSTERNIPGLLEQAEIWLNKYPSLAGVILNHHPEKNNVIFGEETITIAGRSYLTEMFADIKLQLEADTFFQVNTEAAETLSRVIIEQLNLKGDEIAIDAYCGIGTFTIPLAKKVKRVIGIESHTSSVERARLNAEINNITNTDFQIGTVEEILRQTDVRPQIILLDPPRKGCEKSVIEAIIDKKPQQLAYISCQPATLARDLKLLCDSGNYYLRLVQPADFFPQTTHVESVAFLQAESK